MGKLMKYDPTITLGTVIQCITLILLIVAGYTVSQIQISINTREISTLKTRDAFMFRQFEEFKRTNREDLNALNKSISELNVNIARLTQAMVDMDKRQ